MSPKPKLRSIGNGNRQANVRSGEDHCKEDQERDIRSSKVGGWNCGEGSDVEVKSIWHQRTHGRQSEPSDGTKPNVEQGYLQGYLTLILNNSPHSLIIQPTLFEYSDQKHTARIHPHAAKHGSIYLA